ncbi:MAG: hypothetical protein XE04_0969 [Marinimicrobia bacterium 46_43]|nr:MAG: hypothetical protein XE04_0969 [Marinimicrobia bacterium 46_43]
MIRKCVSCMILLAGFFALNLEGNTSPVHLNGKPVNNQLITRDHTDSAPLVHRSGWQRILSVAMNLS